MAKSVPPPPRSPLLYFVGTHWRGLQVVLTPLVAALIFLKQPVQGWQWCLFALVVMASYWVTECVPLPVTSFIPLLVFPLAGVMDAPVTAKCYMNDTIMVFLASLMLAASVEQSGLHVRIALAAIRAVGYSHYKLLLAMCLVTMFVSMWLTNTAATTMMVPIIFALLTVFEEQKLLSIYEVKEGVERAAPLTVLYFCAATYSATIGGIGTLIGTGTNLVFKGLMDMQTKGEVEYITFPLFSAFAVPYMLVLQLLLYLALCVQGLGLFRPKSAAARRAQMTPAAVDAAKGAVGRRTKAIGTITCWECMVVTLFGLAIALFFSRSPRIFKGWADLLIDIYSYQSRVKDKSFQLGDSANALAVVVLMLLMPSSMGFFRNCTARYKEQLPRRPIESVLRFNAMDKALPYSFMFLLGGGFAISKCASEEYTNLNGRIGDLLVSLKALPSAVIVLVVIAFTVALTNFASNVATAYIVVPIGMNLALRINKNPLSYNLAAGLAASYCFMLPVGTPGNLVVQSAAKVATGDMVKTGAAITVISIVLTWAAVMLWAPVVWPDIHTSADQLDWYNKKGEEAAP